MNGGPRTPWKIRETALAPHSPWHDVWRAGVSSWCLVAVARGEVDSYDLPIGEISVGRSRSSSVRINLPDVSRRHMLMHVGETVSVVDLGSSNGTLLRSKQLTSGARVEVLAGSTIQLAEGVTVTLHRRTAARHFYRLSPVSFELLLEQATQLARDNLCFPPLVRVTVASGYSTEGAERALRESTPAGALVGVYQDGEYRVLLCGARAATVEPFFHRLKQALLGHGVRATATKIAWPPQGRRVVHIDPNERSSPSFELPTLSGERISDECNLGDFSNCNAALRPLLEAMMKAKHSAEHAKRAVAAKGGLLAATSQALSLPLDAILNDTELLLVESRDQGDDHHAADLEKIDAAARHLKRLIHDLFDLSRAKAGQVELCYETMEVSTVLQQAIAGVRPLLNEMEVALEVRCDEGVGSMVMDVTRIQQCLVNLLANASKFGASGTVTLDVAREGRAGDDWMVFRVTDQGCGMTEAELTRIFEPFAQASSAGGRGYGGTGLGLTITRKLVALMGGFVTAHSTPGQGSVFTFHLPCRPLTNEQSSAANRGPFAAEDP